MVQHLGDFAEDATVYIYFNTFSSNDPSASVTVTDLVAGDIKVYKDGSITQIVTDGATVTVNFDTVELGDGVHLLTIDTSADAAYSIGSDYMVRVEGITVDAGTINAAIATFSIENRYVTTVVNTIASDLLVVEAAIDSDQIQNDDFVSNIHSRLVIVETAIDSDQVQNDNFVSDVHSRLVIVEATIDSDQSQTEASIDSDQLINDVADSNIHSRLVIIEATIDSDQAQTEASIDSDQAQTEASIDSDQVQNDAFVSNIHSRLVVIETAIDSDQVINDATADTIASDLILYLDTAMAELSVAVPATTPTVREALMLPYMALRNQLIVQTSGTDALEVYNDAGTLITKKLITDDSSDYTEAKMS